MQSFSFKGLYNLLLAPPFTFARCYSNYHCSSLLFGVLPKGPLTNTHTGENEKQVNGLFYLLSCHVLFLYKCIVQYVDMH